MTLKSTIIVAVATAAGLSVPALAQTEISLWHAMAGANNEVIDKIASDFNATQSDYKVTPVFKGTYPETLNAGIAAFRAGQAPDIMQVFDVGTGVMMAAEGAIKPVAEVMTEAGLDFDQSQYLPGIVAYYSTPDGTMLSFPYNSSSPILYFNKDIFEKAGLDANEPARDLGRGLGGGEADQGVGRRALRLHLGLADLDPPRELRRLEQRALRQQRERPRRAGGRAPDQRADLRQPLPGDRRPRQGRHLQVRRPHVRGQADLPRRRMRHLHRQLGRHRRHHQVRA